MKIKTYRFRRIRLVLGRLFFICFVCDDMEVGAALSTSAPLPGPVKKCLVSCTSNVDLKISETICDFYLNNTNKHEVSVCNFELTAFNLMRIKVYTMYKSII